jgi:hypothetical protein
MNKTITALFLLVFLAAPVAAQSKNQTPFPSNPDGFREFVLDKSTAEEIIKSIGKPEKDKADKLEVSRIGKWLDAKHKEQIFRQLTYNSRGDFLKIEFSFLEEKLVMIDLEFKKYVSPEKLPRLFGVQFEALGGPVSLPDKPGLYPNVGFSVTRYPSYYSMIGISKKTFIFINCASAHLGSSPGRVVRTRQVSRVLEKK